MGGCRTAFLRCSTCDASGHGEGSVLFDSATIDLDCTMIGLDNPCSGAFRALVYGEVQDGRCITATATSAGGHTSEFSPCQEVGNDTIVEDGFE
jgi:hypothetical protein